MDVLKSKCLSQIILIINDCLEIMNIDIKLNLLKEKFDESKRWIQRESLKELYQFTQVILKDSIFGKIFENSIFALISCLSFINIDEKGILSLIDLCFSIFNPFSTSSDDDLNVWEFQPNPQIADDIIQRLQFGIPNY